MLCAKEHQHSAGKVTERSLRGWVLGVAAIVAVISGAGIIGRAAGAPGQSRSAQGGVSARALEPGFTGTFLYRNDNFRTGRNLAESVLTPSTVTASNFGLQFTDAIDAAAYAQPLYVPNVNIPNQGTHNVVYVATENDSVYAFDADNAGPALWQISFIDPADGITPVPSSDLGCDDLTPIIGITATPVIDPATGKTPWASTAGNFTFGYPGASPVISSNGTTGGILWAIDSSQWNVSGPATLYAFDATNLANELYDSNQISSDDPGPAVKFTVPTVANGSVYMGTQTQLAVFGLLPVARADLTILPNSLAFGNQVTVGTTSKPKTITIKNRSSKQTRLVVNVEMESASPPVFAVKSECEKPLMPGKSCKASVTFEPADTAPQSGNLMISDNVTGSPQTVKLSGTGQGAKEK